MSAHFDKRRFIAVRTATQSWGDDAKCVDGLYIGAPKDMTDAIEALVSAVREYFNPQLGRETQGQEHYTVTQLKAALKRVEEEMR